MKDLTNQNRKAIARIAKMMGKTGIAAIRHFRKYEREFGDDEDGWRDDSTAEHIIESYQDYYLPNLKRRFKRGDLVYLHFPDDLNNDLVQWKVSAVWPENRLDKDRADICRADDAKAFRARRGIGMPVKYLKKI